MQITAILLKNYRQFRSFYLSLVNPDTGEPLQNICLIGANATGKSTLLALIAKFLETGKPQPIIEGGEAANSLIGFRIQIQIEHQINDYYIVAIHRTLNQVGLYILNIDIEKDVVWQELWAPDAALEPDSKEFRDLLQRWIISENQIKEQIKLQPNSTDLAIYAPSDGSSLLKESVPKTNLSNALGLLNELPAFHQVSYDHIEEFWKFLIYQIKKRERDYQNFLIDEDVQSLSVAQARQKFDSGNPEIMTTLAEQWNLILDRAGLEFDAKGAKVPVQLNENLEAYIKRKGTEVIVHYALLSTGIRNFIFRFGHIYSLYFNRKIDRGFLLIDEPELSLFPDLLYDIIERYKSIIQNTQFFVATHSPVIAAQFDASERIILEFDELATVQWRRGISPEGDDPNDLLVNDFAVRSLYGKKGIEQWERFLQLRREIASAEDPQTKLSLLDEYTKIGNAYNFAPDEIPT